MGNKHSAGELHNEAKLAASKFENDEVRQHFTHNLLFLMCIIVIVCYVN